MLPDTKIKFEKILRKYLPDISQDVSDRLASYADLLAEWNIKVNLVSRKEQENIWNHQVIGSLSFLFQFKLESPFSMVDIGTGGGLPGLPLAILFPDSKFLLVDSIQKKILAVTDMAQCLGLTNVKTVWSRAEDLSAKNGYQNRYDYGMARAVAPIEDIIRWGKPFIRTENSREFSGHDRTIPKGILMMLKGGDLADEMSRAEIKFRPKQIAVERLKLLEEIPALTDKKIIIVRP